MGVVLLEGGDLVDDGCVVNAGLLFGADQTREVDADALVSHALWERADDKDGYQASGDFTLALTDREAELALRTHGIEARGEH